MKKPRNRAAQDSTLINIRSLKKALADMSRNARSLARRVAALEKR